METLTLTKPDDMHLHLREGDVMRDVLADSARQFARAIIMPNLKSPVVSTEQALAYRQSIIESLPEDIQASDRFKPLMTLYLTENMTADEISKAKESAYIYATKYYPAGATTNSDSGVNAIENVYPVLQAMVEQNLPLLVHGEVTNTDVDVFDREAIFIEKILCPLMENIPDLRIVFEHITTKDAVDFVRQGPDNLVATITPQHLLLNRNALFAGGIHPHYYCLPVLKAEEHRRAVVDAATSGSPKFFLGTDSAPHARGVKESACGCAGIYSAHRKSSKKQLVWISLKVLPATMVRIFMVCQETKALLLWKRNNGEFLIPCLSVYQKLFHFVQERFVNGRSDNNSSETS